MRVLGATSAAVLALLLPGPAIAATTRVMESSTAQFFEPALAGDSVVADAYRPKEIVDVLAAQPGQKPSLLLRVKSAQAHPAASGDQVLVRRSSDEGDTDIFSGTLAGPLAAIQSCPQDTDLAFQPAPALDGALAVWSAGDCNANHVRVQNGSAVQTIDAGGLVTAVAAAGHYAAWLAGAPGPPRLTVYDVEGGQVAYSTTVGPATQVGLAADGTAVLGHANVDSPSKLCPDDSPAQIDYYTPAEPTAHTLPVPLCSVNQAVEIAAGRIAYVERLASGLDQLTLANLDGSAELPVALFSPRPSGTSFDFDGSRVAWTDIRCRSSLVLRRDASDTSAPEPATTCPVDVGTPRLSRDGTLHVPVACPNGCQPDAGSLEGIQIISPHWLHVIGKTRGVTRYAPFVPFSLKPGAHTVVRLPLTASQRATLRRHGKASVRLKVVLQDVYLPRVIRTARTR